MQTKLEIDPGIILTHGVKLETVDLPKLKPQIPAAYSLVAILTGTSQTAIDVTETSAYAEMYAHASVCGCNYTVELYTMSIDWMI